MPFCIMFLIKEEREGNAGRYYCVTIDKEKKNNKHMPSCSWSCSKLNQQSEPGSESEKRENAKILLKTFKK